MFTATWHRYPHGIEGEAMQSNSREFSNLDDAVDFLEKKMQATKSIYWAGGYVEDDNFNTLYEIFDSGDFEDHRTKEEPATAEDIKKQAYEIAVNQSCDTCELDCDDCGGFSVVECQAVWEKHLAEQQRKQREILFRGKRVDAPKWVYGDFANPNHIVSFITENGKTVADEYEIKIHTLGQYIGLEDKNNNKIFDGDILKFTCTIDDKIETETMFVYWDNTKAGYFGKSKQSTFPIDLRQDEMQDFEIIGNIFDNSDI